jgi:hypothetical protein
MIHQFKLLYTDPERFFNELQSPSYSTVLKFLFYIMFIPYLLNSYFSSALDEGLGFSIFASAAVLALVTILLGPFISSALTHIGVKIFGGSDYKKTFYASAHALAIYAPYALAQAVLIGIMILTETGFLIITALVSVISLFGAIHLIMTEVYGLKVLQGLSTGKAIVSSVVIPFIVIFLVALLVVGLIMASGGLLAPTRF